MANYRRLLSEKEFLKVQIRARMVAKNGTVLHAIYYKDNEVFFQTRSVTDARLIYTERVQFTEVSIDKILKAKTFREIENLFKTGDIKVYCSCPAFLYWGYKYKAWKQGYGIEKETRRPVIRNPYEKGYVCKHLYFLMQVLPYLARPLASKFRYWALKKKESEKELGTSHILNKWSVRSATQQKDSKVDLNKNEGLQIIDTEDVPNSRNIDNEAEPLMTLSDIDESNRALGDVRDTGNGFAIADDVNVAPGESNEGLQSVISEANTSLEGISG